MIKIVDVAKEAGVSKSTVSRVLNHEKTVKDSTRIAVEQAIEKLNYSPSYFAQGIRTRKTKTIAMLVPEYSNFFYSEMFRGAEDIALKHQYMVLVCSTMRHSKSELEYIQELLRRNIDGIIYNTYAADPRVVEYLESISEEVPIVMMNRPISKSKNISYVYTDGYNSTRNAVQYLFEHDCRKIGYLRNKLEISIIEDRYEGYLQGLKDCGLQASEQYVYRFEQVGEPDYIQLGREAASYISKQKDRPDALLTAIDMLAIGCVQQFKQEGTNVPQDVKIIGFDNVALCELVDPALTTIGQPTRKLGQKAAETIIAKINGKAVKDISIFEGELIVRKTT
jgi:DNA-binding LacI/PurR family transcriptional regulator